SLTYCGKMNFISISSFILLLFTCSFVQVVHCSNSTSSDQVTSLPNVTFAPNFRHYAGFLESLNNTFLHYWFFESQSGNPSSDPVILWLNGGPVCSSHFGALTENGPLRLHRNGTILKNSH